MINAAYLCRQLCTSIRFQNSQSEFLKPININISNTSWGSLFLVFWSIFFKLFLVSTLAIYLLAILAKLISLLLGRSREISFSFATVILVSISCSLYFSLWSYVSNYKWFNFIYSYSSSFSFDSLISSNSCLDCLKQSMCYLKLSGVNSFSSTSTFSIFRCYTFNFSIFSVSILP